MKREERGKEGKEEEEGRNIEEGREERGKEGKEEEERRNIEEGKERRGVRKEGGNNVEGGEEWREGGR